MADAPARDWLRLTLVPGVGGESQRNLLKAFGLPESIFATRASALAEVVGQKLAHQLLNHPVDEAAIASALNWTQQPGNHLITLADASYPPALLTIADPPVLLYAKGNIELLKRPAIAMVGSRNATGQGDAIATTFASALAAAGLTVISGLALGIDAAAHRGALQERGSTIAVIGTGADRIYPSRNENLARDIADKGLILSEFPLGTPAIGSNFPRRNRIIAGLAQGVLVVEAAERSGSLITARLAAESGREVFAIPGSIHSPLSKGCHKLIKQGAKLVESAQDVLEELRWEAVVGTPPASSPPEDAESRRLLEILGYHPCDLDTLAERAELTPDKLLAMLLPLELSGHVTQLPGGRYQRIP